MFCIAFLFVGDTILEAIYGQRTRPEWVQKLKASIDENKFQIGIFVFFGSSMI